MAFATACGGGGDGGGDGAATPPTPPPNVPPIASFTATPASGTAPLEVQFDASVSTDSDGSIASYSWSFGDGGTATGVTAQHVYNQAGTFTITLTVKDNLGSQGQTTRTVTVTGNEAPVAELQ